MSRPDPDPQEVERLEAAQARVERAQDGREKALDLAGTFIDLAIGIQDLLVTAHEPHCDHPDYNMPQQCHSCLVHRIQRLMEGTLELWRDRKLE